MVKIKVWQEEKVDKLVHFMRSGKNTIYFDDNEVFGESMFDERSILRKRFKNIDNIFCVDNYLYVWKGDRVTLLTTKTKMKTLIKQ